MVVIKKWFRNLFSGYLLVLLLLLAELGLIFAFQYQADAIVLKIAGNESTPLNVRLLSILLYALVRGIVFLVALIIFFKIINKPENPEFKVPWIVGMLLLPFFFSVLFLIFGNHNARRRDVKILQKSKKAVGAAPPIDEGTEAALGGAVGAFSYLQNTTSLLPHSGNRVTYYSTGEAFFPELIASLKKAEHFILMEFFIISDGAYWSEIRSILIEKAQQNVEVRLIYDDMGCSGTISSATPRKLAKYGIKCVKFHPFRPILSGVYNNRDHRKIVVIDHKMAFTGGMNLADEYGNLCRRFGYWKDTMVKIEGSGIANLITIFLQNFDICTGKLSDYAKYLADDYEKYDEPGFVMPFGDGPGGIDNALIGEQTYINILHYAKKEVFISTPYLVPTYELLDALRNAALRGVRVHLILPGIPDKKLVYKVAKSHFGYLLEAGVNIYLFRPGFNHMKTMLADDALAFVGTVNFDFRSLVHHFECGALLYQTPCMQAIRQDFDRMLRACDPVPVGFKLKGFNRLLCSLIKIISPLL